MNNKPNKGFALTEVLLAIAVIVIIGIVAYPLYTASRDKSKIRNEVGHLVSISASLDKYYVATRNFNNFSSVTAHNLGLLPIDIQYDTDGNPLNVWEGVINISKNTQDADNTKFIIVYTNLPNYACIGLIQEARSIFSQIYVGGTYPAGTYADGTQVFNMNKLSVDQLTTSCKSKTRIDIAFLK